MTRPPWGPVLVFSCHLRGCLVCQDPHLLGLRPSIRALLVLIKICGLASEGLLHCHYRYIAPGFRKPHTVAQPGWDEPPQGKCTSIESRSERRRERTSRDIEKEKKQRCTPAWVCGWACLCQRQTPGKQGQMNRTYYNSQNGSCQKWSLFKLSIRHNVLICMYTRPIDFWVHTCVYYYLFCCLYKLQVEN